MFILSLKLILVLINVIKLSEVNVRILERAHVVVSEKLVFELSTNQQLNVNASETFDITSMINE
jgi:hypothetical protein